MLCSLTLIENSMINKDSCVLDLGHEGIAGRLYMLIVRC